MRTERLRKGMQLVSATVVLLMFVGCNSAARYQALDLQSRAAPTFPSSRGTVISIVRTPEYTESTRVEGGRTLVPAVPVAFVEVQGSFSSWVNSGVQAALESEGIGTVVVDEPPVDGSLYVTLRLEEFFVYISDLQVMFEDGNITGHCDLILRVAVMQDDQIVAYAVVSGSGQAPRQNAWSLPVGEASTAAANEALTDVSRAAARYIAKSIGESS